MGEKKTDFSITAGRPPSLEYEQVFSRLLELVWAFKEMGTGREGVIFQSTDLPSSKKSRPPASVMRQYLQAMYSRMRQEPKVFERIQVSLRISKWKDRWELVAKVDK